MLSSDSHLTQAMTHLTEADNFHYVCKKITFMLNYMAYDVVEKSSFVEVIL